MSTERGPPTTLIIAKTDVKESECAEKIVENFKNKRRRITITRLADKANCILMPFNRVEI